MCDRVPSSHCPRGRKTKEKKKYFFSFSSYCQRQRPRVLTRNASYKEEVIKGAVNPQPTNSQLGYSNTYTIQLQLQLQGSLYQRTLGCPRGIGVEIELKVSLFSLKPVVLNASDLRPVLHGRLLCFVTWYNWFNWTVPLSFIYGKGVLCHGDCLLPLFKRGEGSRYKQFTVTKQ